MVILLYLLDEQFNLICYFQGQKVEMAEVL
jgi:hypothetical protein